VWLPSVDAGFAVAETDDAEGDDDYYPVLAVDEEICDEVVGGVVFVAGSEELSTVSHGNPQPSKDTYNKRSRNEPMQDQRAGRGVIMALSRKEL
jgi:hypothetical protein